MGQETPSIEVDVALLKHDMAAVKQDVGEIKSDVKTLLVSRASASGVAQTLKTIALQIIPFIALIVAVAAMYSPK